MKKGLRNKLNLFARKTANVFLLNMVRFGLLFAIWAILSIEMEWLPKIPCRLSETAVNGWNRAFLTLAYSYIAGAVIYGMTVKYPYSLLSTKKLISFFEIVVKSVNCRDFWSQRI